MHQKQTAKQTESGNPPLMATPVAAGFPSPAEQYIESPLDLNELLVHRPAATFFVRAAGDSMIGAGIRPGDILVVDRSLDARDGSIVIACVVIVGVFIWLFDFVAGQAIELIITTLS